MTHAALKMSANGKLNEVNGMRMGLMKEGIYHMKKDVTPTTMRMLIHAKIKIIVHFFLNLNISNCSSFCFSILFHSVKNFGMPSYL